ncbi:hypothetical protein [Sphingomonas soli]|uniref:hypothetical protein n=1 Tax=Sphingomonas soli TaxID=266127 RepID=UPI0012ED0A8B|nr:hypothetical protein [Sphingomonas soli]
MPSASAAIDAPASDLTARLPAEETKTFIIALLSAAQTASVYAIRRLGPVWIA